MDVFYQNVSIGQACTLKEAIGIVMDFASKGWGIFRAFWDMYIIKVTDFANGEIHIHISKRE